MTHNVSGFKGAVVGLSLTDVIQLKGHNKFNGAISVEFDERQGVIYFVDGEIIHAKLEDKAGEEAIYEILKWPGGTFNIDPEMSTTVCTIHCRTDYLLLDALRRLDEENAGAPVKKTDPPAINSRRTMSKIAARLQEINSITYAVLLDKKGSPVQDSSTEAAALAAKGLFLATTGNQLGDLMGLGVIKGVAVHTSNYDLLMYDSKQHYLSIAVKKGHNLESVESEIKATFVSGK